MSERELAYRPDYAVPPGETLLELLESASMTQAELAGRAGRPRKTINEIIKGRAAITAETALQLEKVLGVPASFWLGLECVYRESLARKQEQAILSAAEGWLESVPFKCMADYSWVQDQPDTAGKVREALAFFGVASPRAWSAVWEAPQAVYRRSEAFQSEPGAVAAWLRRGEVVAREIQCQPYNAADLRSCLQEARLLSVEPPERFVPGLAALCAAAGVAVVFVRELPKAHVSAATRWLIPDKALIQLSLRYKTDDHLWFSFFHEAGHVLLHGRRSFIEEGNGNGRRDDRDEEEANRFASDLLIPPREYVRLKTCSEFDEDTIVEFAQQLGIAPGIVVGRLQHDGLLPWRSRLNALKRRFAWARARNCGSSRAWNDHERRLDGHGE